jgi:aspartate-semialdehyde dehydrogenase
MRGYRVGVVNPFSAFGKRVRALIDERGFPTIELKLFELRHGGGSAITQFKDEVVITQPMDTELFTHLDVIFFGGDEEVNVADEAKAAAGEGILTIINKAPDVDGRVVALGLNDKPAPEPGDIVIAARSASVLLGTVLAALRRSLDVRQARATILLPASDRGDEAVDELHDQNVKILNFQEPPTQIFNDQLAFNLLLPPSDARTRPLDERVAEEAARLSGLESRPSVMLVQAPIFHSYALSLWVVLAEPAEPEAVTKTLAASRRIKAPGKRSPSVPTPVSVAESDKIHFGRVRHDPSTPGGFWIWAVADSIALDPAAHAIQLAEKAFGIKKKT